MSVNGWGFRPMAGSASTNKSDRSRPRSLMRDGKRDEECIRALIARIVRELAPIRGTPGEAYLRDIRKVDTRAISDVLERTDGIGWHAAVYFNEPGHALHGQRLGCIIAVMTDATTAQPTGGISRTYIHQGRKIGKAKGLGPAGVVRLSPDDEVTSGLFIAEGLERARRNGDRAAADLVDGFDLHHGEASRCLGDRGDHRPRGSRFTESANEPRENYANDGTRRVARLAYGSAYQGRSERYPHGAAA